MLHDLGKQFQQPPAAEGIHLQGLAGGCAAAGLGLVDAMVEHEHIHPFQHRPQGPLLADPPDHLLKGDRLSGFIAQIQRLWAAGEPHQVDILAGPATQQGPAEAATCPCDGNGALILATRHEPGANDP